MNEQPGGEAKTSKLTLPGVLLILMGSIVPRPLDALADHTTSHLGSAVLYLGSDLFRLGFFVGVALLISGTARNHRWTKEAEAAKNSAR